MKRIVALLFAVGFGIAAVSLVTSHRRAAQRAVEHAAWEKMKIDRAAELAQASTQPLPPPTKPVPDIRPISPISPITPITPADPKTATTDRPPSAKAPALASVATTPSQPAPRNKPALQDPVAREALSFVGADPEAEEVWAEAINDPDLPPNERKDLIEDLNEDGFPDPKNITEADLPLIMSRLALIEAHAPDAMDDVNAAAFLEAYKDLVKMYARLIGH